MDLNNSSFEFSFISLTGRLILIMGYIFYCDYKFKEGRTKRKLSASSSLNDFQSWGSHSIWKDEALLLPVTSRSSCTVGSLMTAQIISISEKSKITLFTLMRYLKNLDCDHFGEDWFSFFPNARLHYHHLRCCPQFWCIMTTDLWVMHQDNSPRSGPFFFCMLRKHIM